MPKRQPLAALVGATLAAMGNDNLFTGETITIKRPPPVEPEDIKMVVDKSDRKYYHGGNSYQKKQRSKKDRRRHRR